MGTHAASPSFGVEEEYLLLDELTGQPVNRAAQLVRALSEQGEDADREFLASQLEISTPVCHEAAEAEAPLTEFRRKVSQAAAAHRVVIAGTGLPPVGGETAGAVTPKPRYRAIEAEMRDTAAHQYSTGLHVHVEVPSRDAGVDALTRMSRWAPALLAMTANSPLWCGAPTGFSSWRHTMGLTWPVSGYPPPYVDGEEYTNAIDRFVTSGILLDPGVLTWVARLSESFPTIELRIADAQLEVRDSVAFAVLVRALVHRGLRDAREGSPLPRFTPGLVNGAIWMAARDGVEATIVDPLTAVPVPAFDLIDVMLRSVETELDECGDLARVEQYVQRLRREGSPARRQLKRFGEAGVSGLIGLYRSGSAAGIPVDAGSDGGG